MRMSRCISWTLVGLILVLIVNCNAEDKNEEILDSLIIDNTLKSKRPFCNAFTGCGKKRNYYDNSVERQDSSGEWVTFHLPIYIYWALIRIIPHEIRNAIEQTLTIDNSPITHTTINQNYPSFRLTQKLPIRKRYES